jgi:hypothetical protein
MADYPAVVQAAPTNASMKVGGGGVTVTYSKRARDSNGTAPAPPASYVYWSTTDPAGAYPNPPPFGGPLVEEAILNQTSS